MRQIVTSKQKKELAEKFSTQMAKALCSASVDRLAAEAKGQSDLDQLKAHPPL